MAITYIDAESDAGDYTATPNNVTVHGSTQSGDLVIVTLYNRNSSVTIGEHADFTDILEVSTANGGSLYVGWWIAAGAADEKAWSLSGGAAGDSWGYVTTTLRGTSASAPIRHFASVSGGADKTPNPPSCSSGSDDAMFCGFGAMDEYDSPGHPAGFTKAGVVMTTSGNDCSIVCSYDLDGGTGAAVDPAAYGAATLAADAYWYAYTLSVRLPFAAPTFTGLTVTRLLQG